MTAQQPLLYTPQQFATFRIIFGLFLVQHFASLAPYASELYSTSGMLPSAQLNLTYGYFPNLLEVIDSPRGAAVFLWTAVALSLGFALGWRRRACALALFYALNCLYHRNNLTHHLGVNYVGWLLLVSSVVPTGEGKSISQRQASPDWNLPSILYWGGWTIFGLSYTVSGLDKLQNPNWLSGWALNYIAQSPETSEGWSAPILSSPIWVQQWLTWSCLSLELSALPMVLFRSSRRLLWISLLSMHLGIMIVMGFYDLTGGILCFYLLLMDPQLFSQFTRRLRGAPLQKS